MDIYTPGQIDLKSSLALCNDNCDMVTLEVNVSKKISLRFTNTCGKIPVVH